MKFNTKTRYGLRAMIEIAMNDSHNGILQKEIASNQHISEKYLDQIISALKISGLIKNSKGKKSGYILTEDPKNITIRQIIEAFESQISIIDCISEGSICSRDENCAAQLFWSTLNHKFIDYADSVSLYELATMEKNFNKLRTKDPMYYI